MAKKNVFKNMVEFGKEQSPNIMLGVGLAGMAGSVIFAVKSTKTALEKIKEAEVAVDEDGNEVNVELTTKEKVAVSWKYYIPTGLLFLGSTGLILTADHINGKRYAALGTACTILQNQVGDFDKYRSIIREKLGIEDEREIHNQAVTRNKDLFSEDDTKNIAGQGDTLFYDPLTCRYFRSTEENLLKGLAKFVLYANMDFAQPLSRLYGEWGLEYEDIHQRIGWSCDDRLTIEFYELKTHPVTGEPCKVISYSSLPRFEFDRL